MKRSSTFKTFLTGTLQGLAAIVQVIKKIFLHGLINQFKCYLEIHLWIRKKVGIAYHAYG